MPGLVIRDAAEARQLSRAMEAAMRNPSGRQDSREVKAERAMLEDRFGVAINWSA